MPTPDSPIAPESILIIDFGSQVTQLIARRVREAGVYSEIVPYSAAEAALARMQPKGVILSGSPASVPADGSPRTPQSVFDSGLPVLGICYGQQVMSQQLGGRVEPGGVDGERDGEFGGLGWPAKLPSDAMALRFKGQPAPVTATTIAMVATDAVLSKAACKRLAIMANDGLSKALRPVHAPNDGDTVFAAATGRMKSPADAGLPPIMTELGTVAADCLARAVARGVYEATALPFPNALPDWKTRFGAKR